VSWAAHGHSASHRHKLGYALRLTPRVSTVFLRAGDGDIRSYSLLVSRRGGPLRLTPRVSTPPGLCSLGVFVFLRADDIRSYSLIVS
jgi:hypothetical protein